MAEESPTLKGLTAPAKAQALTLDEAFRLHGRYVAGVAFRLLGGGDDEINDVVQDVFMHAFDKLAQVREPQALRAWLATMTVRLVRKRLRYRRLRGFLGLESVSNHELLIAPGLSPEDRVTLGRVYVTLAQLPVDHRLAWSLRHLEGEPLENVALLCSCSLATAKRRIAAAHQVIEEEVVHE